MAARFRFPLPRAWLVVMLLAVARSAFADEADVEFFEKRIRPLLVQHCYECHSADAKKIGGGLLLDSRDGVARGGESGAAVVAKKPDESLLIKAIRYGDDSVKMPPKGKLPVAAIADLEEWIRRGVPDPRDQPAVRRTDSSWEAEFRERATWWSLQPVGKPVVPTPKNVDWSDQAIDHFLLEKLELAGLSPAEVASPRTLARRLSLVLTGLPPTAEQVAALIADNSTANAPSSRVRYEQYVDSLLNSPHFGERWARHWMDVVRFTETHGNEWNYEVHHAWRYRDYLIRAFNADVPFDQLIVEHIAGDLLPVGSDSVPTDSRRVGSGQRPSLRTARLDAAAQFNESPIGTGFFRFGEVNHDDCISLPDLGYDIADNQLDTLTKAFQATTVACARCHDHKLDAVSMRDYYGLLGVIRSSRLVAHTIDSPEANAAIIQRLRGTKSEMRRELARLWRLDAESFATYMQAAEAAWAKRTNATELAKGLDAKRLEKWVAVFSAEKQPLEDVFEVWRQIARAENKEAEWTRLGEQHSKEARERAEFNRASFVTWADFRGSGAEESEPRSDSATLGAAAKWHIGGQGLRTPLSQAGEFAIHSEGDSLVKSVLPAGAFTNAVSDKLNGTLRSPMIPLGKKHISFEVLGQRSSAVRLVSNNCQLNYKNYKALTKPELSWLTFSPPDEREQLRTYAELMTMFDNPKFPDQLSALGGDTANYRLPWEKAAENPRSYFGITRVVLHDAPEPPKNELSHLRRLFDPAAANAAETHSRWRKPTVRSDGMMLSHEAAPTNCDAIAVSRLMADFADSSPQRCAAVASHLDSASSKLAFRVTERYVAAFNAALDRWVEGKATDNDAGWLDVFVRRELLTNQPTASPRLDELTKQFRQAEAELTLPTVVAGLSDGGPGFDQPMFARGDCRRPGETVPRRFLEVLGRTNLDGGKAFDPSGSGRMQLALQIASRDNPLTARVFVNRVWHYLFGTGLVRSVDDFGHVGDLPSHPELLDHLATQFMNEGWSIKKLIRSIVSSKTFQLAASPSPQAKELDPQNRWLSHYPARRLEAEAIRDAILATSGRLDRTLFGMSVHPFRDKEYADRRLFPGPLDGAGRRSLYIKNNLMEAPKFLGAFNIPGGKVTQGRRDITNVPAQALALLNDPFVLQQADVWAGRLIEQNDTSVTGRLDRMFQTAFARPASPEELSRVSKTIDQIAELHSVPPDRILASRDIWKDVAHALFNLKEFIYIP